MPHVMGFYKFGLCYINFNNQYRKKCKFGKFWIFKRKNVGAKFYYSLIILDSDFFYNLFRRYANNETVYME